MLENLMSIAGIGGGIASMYSAFSAIGTGQFQRRILRILELNKVDPLRLSDRVLYVPQSSPITLSSGATAPLDDMRDVRELLERIRAVLDGEIISSAALQTPAKLRSEFATNPLELPDRSPASRQVCDATWR